MTYELIHGDCLEVMKTMPDNSVDAVVTDPPYGLSFMGKKWDYDVPSEDIWAECLRVLKPGGHLLALAGTRTQHRMAVRIEDAGFEIRDMIAWVYGSGFPKSLNLKDEWQGWGTALKPAMEPITVARKPLIGTVAENVLQHGTGGINVDGCRVETGENLSGGSGRVGGFAGKTQGGDTSDYRVKGNPQGRWPANLIHDGSDEVMGLLNEAARFYYCAKASKADRDEGCEYMVSKPASMAHGRDENSAGAKNPRAGIGAGSEFREGNSPRKNLHPTVKPTQLMRYLCRLVTPPNGIVLDPFTGSGSTGKACKLEGFSFIGIEREAEYVEIAKARINNVKPEPKNNQLNLL